MTSLQFPQKVGSKIFRFDEGRKLTPERPTDAKGSDGDMDEQAAILQHTAHR